MLDLLLKSSEFICIFLSLFFIPFVVVISHNGIKIMEHGFDSVSVSLLTKDVR